MTGYEDDPFGADGSADEFVRKQLISIYRRRVIGAGLRWRPAMESSLVGVEGSAAANRSAVTGEGGRTRRLESRNERVMDQPLHPHMSVLLSPDGRFADSMDENRIGEALPYEAPVEGALPTDLQLPLYT